MKKLILAFALAATCFAGYSQTNSIGGSATNIPPLSIGLPQFLANGSNFVIAFYGMRDLTDHSYGGGIGLGYRINPNIVPVVRIDMMHDGTFVAEGQIQFELPITFANGWQFIPLAFAGVETRMFSGSNTGDAIGVVGAGAALRFPINQWFLPRGLIGDYEHLSGAGFNNDQLRFGVYFALGGTRAATPTP